MVRGDLPSHTPLVPRDSFLAIDFLYRYLLGADKDLGALEGLTAKASLSLVSNTTLQDMAGLVIQLPGLKKLRWQAKIFTSANVKLRHFGPAGSTLVQVGYKVTTGAAITAALDTAYSAADIVATNPCLIEFEGILHNGATAGLAGLRWAQNASNVTPSLILAGSWAQYSLID